MRTLHSRFGLSATALALAAIVSGCQQTDQPLPFELAEGEGSAQTLGPAGGTVSVPPSFSIEIPPGALSGSTPISVTPRIDAPFPADAGVAVPGTAYDVTPEGTPLALPARVVVAVDPALLEVGEDVRLALAVIGPNGNVVTVPSLLDTTNGLLIAEVDELGAVAVVVSVDAVAVDFGSPPALDGGAIPAPAPPGPTGPAPTSHGGVEFAASCMPESRRCFSSGVVRLWADDVVRQRMGETMVLLSPEVEATLDFISFDQNGIPTEVVGSVGVGGQLAAKLGKVVTRRTLDEGVTTGPGADPQPTSLQIIGNVLIVGQTTTFDNSIDFNEEVAFDVRGVGTSDMLVIEVEAEIDFENQDQSTTTGIITAHVRLRR